MGITSNNFHILTRYNEYENFLETWTGKKKDTFIVH